VKSNKLIMLGLCLLTALPVQAQLPVPQASGINDPKPTIAAPKPVPTATKPKPKVVPKANQLTLEPAYQGVPGSFILIKATTNAKKVEWFSKTDGLNIFPGEMLADPLSTVVSAQVAGTYTLVAYTAFGDVPSKPVTTVVTVGTPKPVDPVVPPKPVDPNVVIPSENLRVLILIDRETEEDNPARTAYQGSWMFDYLNKKAPGRWHMWDDSYTDDQITAGKEWLDVYKLAKEQSKGVRPWIMVTNGKAGSSDTFTSEEQLKALIIPYGGD
jgi:hypothetical protein